MRDAGPRRAPFNWSCRNPPHCQMPDAARAAVLAAPVASGPSWEAVAHALGLQQLCCNSGLSGAKERFEDICCYCFSVHQGPASQQGSSLGLPESPSGTIADEWGQWEASSTLPAHSIVWFGCLQGGNLGVLQGGWGQTDEALSSSFWPARPGQ